MSGVSGKMQLCDIGRAVLFKTFLAITKLATCGVRVFALAAACVYE